MPPRRMSPSPSNPARNHTNYIDPFTHKHFNHYFNSLNNAGGGGSPQLRGMPRGRGRGRGRGRAGNIHVFHFHSCCLLKFFF